MHTTDFVRSAVFILLFILLFLGVNQIVERKSLDNPHNDTVKIGGFRNQPPNSLDVITVGSSHAYCTVDPLVIFRDSGIPSYVLSSESQPIYASYYYIKEALKTQSPKVIMVEMYMVTSPKDYPDETAAYDAVDYLPFSRNKIDLIHAIVPPGERDDYYFNFLKYHSRWKNLNSEDFSLSYKKDIDLYKGYAFIDQKTDDIVSDGVYDSAKPVDISDKNLEYMKKIVQLSRDKKFDLVFLIAPYRPNEREAGIYKSVRSFADQNGVPTLDMNLMYKELNFYEPGLFCDGSHLNCYGSDKVSSFLAGYLKEKYDLADRRGDKNYSSWNTAVQYYTDQVNQ